MKLQRLHSWDLAPERAIALQDELVAQVQNQPPLELVHLVAGTDVAYDDVTHTVYAGVVVLRISDWTIVEKQGVIGHNAYPYVPGLLSFREAPVLLEALARVESEPDLIMCDGQGRAHPRRFGLACHVGLWLDRPCLGIAKSRYLGDAQNLGMEAGSTADLIDQGETIGKVVRTRTGVKPVFVSVGHKIDLESAVKWVLAASVHARVPEPTRQADIYVNALRRGDEQPSLRQEQSTKPE